MKVALSFWISFRYAWLGNKQHMASFLSGISIFGLSLGVAILITVLSVMNGFDNELRSKILGIIPHGEVVAYEKMQHWQSVKKTLDKQNIIGSAPFTRKMALVSNRQEVKGVLLQGVDPKLEKDISIVDEYIVAGDWQQFTDNKWQIVLGKALADQLNISVGDKVVIILPDASISAAGFHPRSKRFTVAAIVSVGTLVENSLALIALSDSQKLFRLGDQITGLHFTIDDLFQINAITSKLYAVLPPGLYITPWTQQYGAVYESIKISKTIVALLLFLIIAVAAFNVVASLTMVVKSKQGDIAILRTMGCTTLGILVIFISQGLLVGLSGILGGVILGGLLSYYITDIISLYETLSNSQLLSVEVYPINYLPSDLRLYDVSVICLITLGLCLIATIYPAVQATKVQPARALRYE